METTKKVHESRLVDGHIAYFKFLKGNAVSAYGAGLQEFIVMAQKPEVDALMVVVEDDETMFGEEMQKNWLDTGDFADANGINKWGIVVPSLAKEITIDYLVSGGDNKVRDYEHFIADNEEEILSWCQN